MSAAGRSRQSRKAHLPGDVKEVKLTPIMLTRLREIVEKVASAPRLNEALNILVTDICLAMETDVCSVYLADHDRRCYYLMATRGLKKPRGRTVTLAFDEGIVGLVGQAGRTHKPCRCAKAPQLQIHPFRKRRTLPRLPGRADYPASPAAWRTRGTAAGAAPVRRKRRVLPGDACHPDGRHPLSVAA